MFFTRKIAATFSVLAFLLIGSQSMAAQADPKGAYDLFWGESIQTVKEKVAAKKWKERKNLDNFKQYVAILPPNQPSFEYSAKIDGYRANILLVFRDNRLFQIVVDYMGENRKREEKLKQVLIGRYGPPTDQGPDLSGWDALGWEAGDSRMAMQKMEVNREKNFVTMLSFTQISTEAKASKELVEYLKNEQKKAK